MLKSLTLRKVVPLVAQEAYQKKDAGSAKAEWLAVIVALLTALKLLVELLHLILA
ncbi:hypothetical protein [Deinococcus aluminii]|uniref:hypothetical protein n=1 Tax=Deinococcus aluminii TaxID=1656885 RepID=UPI0031EFE396